MQEVLDREEKDEEEGQNEAFLNNAVTNRPDEYATEYDKVLEGINASLRYNRRSSLHGKLTRKISQEGSRATLNSLRNDTRVNIEDTPARNIKASNAQGFTGLRKSPSHTALELR
jgi:hypothetical protein